MIRTSVHVLLLGTLAFPAPASAQNAESLPLRGVGQGHTQRIYRGVFTPDSKTFLSAGIDQVVRAWSVPEGKPLFTLAGHTASIHGLGLSGDKLLVTGGEDGAILLWDIAQRRQIAQLGKTRSNLHSLAVSPNGKLAATGGGDWKKNTPGELKLWDLEKREEIFSFPGHRRLILGVAFSPDSHWLAAVDYSGDLHVWDLATRKIVVSLFQESPAGSVGFSPDGKQLVVGDYKGRLNVWDTTNWLDEGVALGHPGGVMHLGYAPGGKFLASAGWNGTVKLWSGRDVEAVRPLQVTEHKDKAWFAGFSPDGKTLASAGEDRLVKFWGITPAAEERFALAPAGPPPALTATRTGAARLAVIASHPLEAARNIADLSLAALGQEKDITLLSRDDVDKILKEQNLTKSNLVEASSAVALGKILAVDLLAVIDAPPEAKQVLGFVVFDAATGARLHDDGFTGDKLELQVRTVAGGVRQAAQRWRAGLGQLRTVCFLPVRNADLPRGYDVFVQALGATLERQLAQNPGIVTLERQWLDSVNKEKGLTSEAAARELLASVLVVQLEVGRREKGQGLRANVLLRDNAGRILHEISSEIPGESGAELLGPLVSKVHLALKTKQGTAQVKHSREGRRFLREAQVLWRHLHFRQALQAAEAAYALLPNDDTRLALAEYLHQAPRELWKKTIDPADRNSFPPVVRTPEDVRAGLSMIRRGHHLIDQAKSRVDELPDHGWYYSLAESGPCFYADKFTCDALAKIKVKPADPDLDQELREFRLVCVERHLSRLREIAAWKNRAPGDRLQRMTAGIHSNYLSNIETMAPDVSERLKAVRAVTLIWLDLAMQSPAETFPAESGRRFAESALHCLYQPYHSKKEPYPAADLEASLPLLEDLKKHPHPLPRLYAEHAMIRHLLTLDRLSAPEAQKRYQSAMDEAKRWIDQVPWKAPDIHRQGLYDFAVHMLRYPPGKGFEELAERLFEEWADFMLQRKDVAWYATVTIATHGPVQHEHMGRKLDKIRRFQAMYHGPEHRLFNDPGKDVPRQLKNVEDNLVKAMAFIKKESPKVPWDKVDRLAEVEKLPNALHFFQSVRQDQKVYFLVANFDPAAKNQVSLQLHAVTLEGGPAQPLGKIAIAPKNYGGKNPHYAFNYSSEPYVHTCVIHKDWFIAATNYDGIYLFPLGGGQPIHIGEAAGLPDQQVLGLTALEGQVFASLEHGYLVQFDLEERRVEVLASSRRAGKLSPFDNDKPFRIWSVLADPERRRLLFPVNLPAVSHPNLGMWEYSLKTREFKKLLPMFVFRFSEVQNDQVYIQQRPWNQEGWLGRFDLAKNEFTLLQGRTPNGVDTQKPQGLPPKFHARFNDHLYHGGYLWEHGPFARRPIPAGPEEGLSHPGRGYSWNVYMRQALEPVGDDRFLVGDWRGLYVLHMKATKAP